MYTILHISDLHRPSGGSISNSELLSSLIADFQRSPREAPGLTRPDAIVVSGDLVQGLCMGSESYPDALKAQYEEALQLLLSLSEAFLDGDNARIIIVPGNHDVDWNAASTCFHTEDLDSHGVTDPRALMANPEMNYRWSWPDRQIYRIGDLEAYQRRFDYYNQMYIQLYKDAPLPHSVHPERPWNLFSLDGGNILIAAFNSCVFNDCFSNLAHLRSQDLADCHLEMTRHANGGCLPVAVWHHPVGGPPLASDYLDLDTVKQLIDKGFRLGLHGHRHDSTVSPVDLFLSTREKMAVIGAGSLSAMPQALPQGVNRRYNLIQLDLQDQTGRVHVREMNQTNIWGPGQFFESGGHSYVQFDWTPSSLDMIHQGKTAGSDISMVQDIERLLSQGQLEEARIQLTAAATLPPAYKRKLLTKLLSQDEAWSELKELLKCPANDEELALYVASAERSGDIAGVDEVLRACSSSGKFSSQLLEDLNRRVAARSRL